MSFCATSRRLDADAFEDLESGDRPHVHGLRKFGPHRIRKHSLWLVVRLSWVDRLDYSKGITQRTYLTEELVRLGHDVTETIRSVPP